MLRSWSASEVAGALLHAVGLLLAASVASPAFAGEVRGRVALHGVDASDVVIYVKDAPGPAPAPPAKRPVINQRFLKYAPRVLAVSAGTEVDFCNQDGVAHNTFSPTAGSKFDLGAYPRGECRPTRFDKPGMSVVLCNVHVEMVAYVMVFAHGLFTQPAPDGSFALPHVPGGEQTVVLWRPRMPPIEQVVKVGEGEPAVISLELP